MDNEIEKIESNYVEIFDPRAAQDDNQTQRNVWSSQSVELFDLAIANGEEVTATPYNKRIKGVNLRNANLPFELSQDEMDLMKLAMNDKILFGNNFIELKDGDKGWVKVKLRDYQEDLLSKYREDRFHIVKFPRQSGKTTTTIVEIVHFLTFNFDKDCVVIAQSQNVIDEILGKIKTAFSKLPFYMQPGFVKFTADEINLDNGCRLKIGIASESVVQGFSLDFLFIDEFAYIPESKCNKFWMNVYPALMNNSKSRCILASTPNGRNKFYEIWVAAIKKQNSFITSEIDWFDVPRSMSNDEFKRAVIQDIGLEGWLMGYECSFDTKLRAIIHTNVQQKLRKIQANVEANPEYYWSKDNHSLGHKHDFSFINSEIIDYDIKNDYFIMGIDIGEGLGEDSSTVKVRKVEYNNDTNELNYKLVAVYHDNESSVNEFATNFMKFAMNFDVDKIKVAVENNNYGGEFFAVIDNYLMNTTEYNDFDNYIFSKFYRDSKEDFERGIRWNKANKKIAVKNYKNLLTKGIFDDTYPDSINEIMNFGKNKNGTYASQYGHDDLVMNDVTSSYYIVNPNEDTFISDLELILNPIKIEEKRIEEELKKNKFVYKTSTGFTLRNHKEKVKGKKQLLFGRTKQRQLN